MRTMTLRLSLQLELSVVVSLQVKPLHQGVIKDMHVGALMEHVSIDLTNQHPKSSKGKPYCLTIIKWAESFHKAVMKH